VEIKNVEKNSNVFVEYFLKIFKIDEKNKIKDTISTIPTIDHSKAERFRFLTINIEKYGLAIPTEK